MAKKKKVEKWVDEPVMVGVTFYDFQHTPVQDILVALSQVGDGVKSGAAGGQVEIGDKDICEWHRKFEKTS
jgi:hypothetical protein